MRTHADPADLPITPDNKRRTPREIDGVYSERLVDAVSPRYLSLFIEKNREGVGVSLNVLFSLEEPIDLLRGDEDHARVALGEFPVSGLKLSQLGLTVGSPGPANKHQRHRFAAVIRKPHDPAIGSRKFEIGSVLSGLEGSRRCSQHCYNFGSGTSIV